MVQFLAENPRYEASTQKRIACGQWVGDLTAYTQPLPGKPGRASEDLAFFGANYAGVLDGVGVANNSSPEERGSTPWFVRRLATRIDEILAADPERDLTETLQIARGRVAGELDTPRWRSRREALQNPFTQFPSATASILRMRGDGTLDAFNFCDAFTLLDTRSGIDPLTQNHDPHTPYPEDEYGGVELRDELLRSGAIETPEGVELWKNARSEWKRRAHKNLPLRNLEDLDLHRTYLRSMERTPRDPAPGFFVLSAVPHNVWHEGRNLAQEAERAILHGEHRNIPLKDINQVLIGSDGLFRALSIAGMSEKELLATADQPGGVQAITARVRAAEAADPLCFTHLRSKVNDDATGVSIKFSQH